MAAARKATGRTSIKAAAAAKSLPDMFSQGIYEDRMLFKQLIDQKLVREIPESIYKNYKYLGTTMYRYAKTESVDGKMYFLPRSDMAQQYNNGNSVALYYRLDWALGSGAITAGQAPTWKQLIDLMTYFHQDPDKNGSVDTWALTSGGAGPRRPEDGVPDDVRRARLGARRRQMDTGRALTEG